MLALRSGRVTVDGKEPEALKEGATLIIPPTDQPRTLIVRADSRARVIRVIHGPGHGFVRGSPLARR